MEENPNYQQYYQFIQKLLICKTNEQLAETEQANQELINPTLLEVFEQSIVDAQQNGKQSLAEHLTSLSSWLFRILCQKTMVNFLNTASEEVKQFMDGNANYLLTEFSFEVALELKARHASQPEMVTFINKRLNFILEWLWQLIEAGANPAEKAQQESFLRKAITLSEKQNPLLWAAAKFKLGCLYVNNSKRNQANLVETAIACFEQALQVFTKQGFPQSWAATQTNLGLAYEDRIEGDKAQNLEMAIACFEQALQVYSKQDFPQAWAATQNFLGTAYRERIREDKALNLEKAITCFEQTLQVFTKNGFPQEWATTQTNLGNAYVDRISEDKALNLESAIACFEQALQVHTKQDSPKDWAATQNSLGNAYVDRIGEGKAQNLEQAIACYQQALQVFTKQDFPKEWATTQIFLGNTYLERVRGDKAQNLEKSMACYQKALQVRTRQDFPQEWAAIQYNLGIVYRNRIRGDKAQNLEKSMGCYQKALQIRTKQGSPKDWATTQNGLGIVYVERISGDKAQNLESAIACFEQALQVHTKQDSPKDWAATQSNLGNAYRERTREDRIQNLEQAIACYQQALQEFTKQRFPKDWATTQSNLGNAYQERIRGDRIQNLEQAIACYLQALQVFSPESFPFDCRRTGQVLGDLLFEQKRWAECRRVLEITHQANENLRGEVQRQEARKQLAQENARMYRQLVYVCLLQQDTPAAIRYVSAAKGRSLSDRLNAGANNLEELLKNDLLLAAKWQPVTRLRQTLDDLMAQLSHPPADVEIGNTGTKAPKREAITQQIAQIRQELKEQLDELFFQFPALSATNAAPILEPEDAMKLSAELGDIPLVEYYRHMEGLVAFVVTQQAIHCVKLVPDPIDTIDQVWQWMLNMESGVGDAFNPVEVREHLTHLYQALIAPIKHLLPDKGPLVIAPTIWMHLMPFQIAYDANHRRYLMDDYILTFTPSLAALRALYRQRKYGAGTLPAIGIASRNLLSVVYSASIMKLPLQNVLPEAEAIAKHFAPPPASVALHESEATPNQVVQVCRKKAFEVVHFGCHGYFDFDQPDNSGLVLADNKLLTVERIRTELRLKKYPLVTLGACQSGRSLAEAGDEATGLILSFLAAGAEGVVSSLWIVHDASTRILFEAFYQERRNNLISDAEALRLAMLQVRQRLNWWHPFFWAAFQVTGLPVNLKSS